MDSSAALGTIGRKGSGKMRHVRVGLLWVPEQQEEGVLSYKKVGCEDNPADAPS